MDSLKSSDLENIRFRWLLEGHGAVPLFGAKFKAKFFKNHFPCETIWEVPEELFAIEGDPRQGVVGLKLLQSQINQIFSEDDSVSLLVTGRIPGSGETPILKRNVIR